MPGSRPGTEGAGMVGEDREERGRGMRVDKKENRTNAARPWCRACFAWRKERLMG